MFEAACSSSTMTFTTARFLDAHGKSHFTGGLLVVSVAVVMFAHLFIKSIHHQMMGTYLGVAEK
jgi:hypothetical protein